MTSWWVLILETVFVLLHLSAAFDTVDHNMLIDRLKHQEGLGAMVLMVLFDMCSSMSVGDLSSIARLSCGAPRGSILGPHVLAIYILPLGHIICHLNISLITDMQTILSCIFHLIISNWTNWLSSFTVWLMEGNGSSWSLTRLRSFVLAQNALPQSCCVSAHYQLLLRRVP